MPLPPNDLSLSVESFVRSVSLNRDTPHSLFLGAGASVSSGMPSAEKCVLQWKGQLFTSANPGLEAQIGNVILPSVQRRIQAWLDKLNGFPPADAEDEYGYYFEQCYPLAEDRRSYFQQLVRSARPSFGYQLLALLAEAGVLDSVWTTNFDDLVARATAETSVAPIEVGLDTTDRIDRVPRAKELLCVAIHGDYRYDALKNTTAEIREQDAKLRQAFVRKTRNRTLIVIGYSGRDHSVAGSLRDAATEKGVGRLFWCGFQTATPSVQIANLITSAREAGRQAFYVNTNGFDDVMRRLALQCLEGQLASKANALLSRNAANDAISNTPFHLAVGQTASIVKTNCFPLDCPSEVYQFSVPDLRRSGAWAALRETLKDKELAAGILGQSIIGIGLADEFRTAFGLRLVGEIERSPIAEHELAMRDGTIAGVLRQALVRSLARRAGIESDRDRVLWEPKPYQLRDVYRWKCAVYRAAVVSLKRASGRQYLVIMPSVFGRTERGGELPDFVEKELKRQILSTQYNQEFNAEVEHWRSVLFPKGAGALDYPFGSGSSFRFRVRRAPAFARITLSHPKTPANIPSRFADLLQFDGTVLPEPKLVFSSSEGMRMATDPHPIRGILRNRPELSLHDLTKAYCVQRGVASQFLRESTLAKRFDCEVMWWLSLSLYAKSMRTPWVLDSLPDTTAFAGLGFGVRRQKTSAGHIVLGCSHIYTSEGIGLTYRLTKVENPVFVQKNPHLSEDDAIKVAEDIRQLFFDSRGRLPERVVIHKRMPFLKAEREGLLKGLKEASQIDLVEINVEPAVRCTASTVVDNRFAAHGSPIDRGTTILFDRYQFLLWVNGNAHPTSEQEDYYMGRFRIPAPVLVRKHWGPTSLSEISFEILALSKMNWNTFDLYARLPATIHSSNEIARIGKLLQRFERESFDYRLFI